MSRSRKKHYLTPDHGKKGRFPRNHKKLIDDFMEDESPVRTSMRRAHSVTAPYGEGCRGVYADTHKIRRVLGKQVGRPWNEVQSEFLKEFDSRTFEGHTIREWLEFVIELNVIIQKDGEVTDPRGLRIGYFSEELYVHPETGILCLAPKESNRYRRESTPQKVFELDGTLYHEHEEIWYRVKMQVFEKKKNWWGYGYDYSTINQPDVFIESPYSLASQRGFSHREKYGLDPKGRAWYCIWKQSANSREIARLKSKYLEKKVA